MRGRSFPILDWRPASCKVGRSRRPLAAVLLHSIGLDAQQLLEPRLPFRADRFDLGRRLSVDRQHCIDVVVRSGARHRVPEIRVAELGTGDRYCSDCTPVWRASSAGPREIAEPMVNVNAIRWMSLNGMVRILRRPGGIAPLIARSIQPRAPQTHPAAARQANPAATRLSDTFCSWLLWLVGPVYACLSLGACPPREAVLPAWPGRQEGAHQGRPRRLREGQGCAVIPAQYLARSAATAAPHRAAVCFCAVGNVTSPVFISTTGSLQPNDRVRVDLNRASCRSGGVSSRRHGNSQAGKWHALCASAPVRQSLIDWHTGAAHERPSRNEDRRTHRTGAQLAQPASRAHRLASSNLEFLGLVLV